MNWHVLHLRPRSEKKVASICVIHGIEHYLPLREETKIYQRRKVTVHKPLFNGYLFAAFGPDQRIWLQRTNHLIRVLLPDDEAGLLHDLEQIRLALVADPRLEADVAYRVGRRIRIKAGPFGGIEGILAKMRGRVQVRLNVEMIGQSVALDVHRDLIEFLDD
jgi:transcriptional antiterminator RfaH